VRNALENGKVCSRCGQRKAAGEFRRNRRNRDGLSSWCAACHNEATRRWREENRDRLNEARRVVPRYVYVGGGHLAENPDPAAEVKGAVSAPKFAAGTGRGARPRTLQVGADSP